MRFVVIFGKELLFIKVYVGQDGSCPQVRVTSLKIHHFCKVVRNYLPVILNIIKVNSYRKISKVRGGTIFQDVSNLIGVTRECRANPPTVAVFGY